MKLVIYHPDPGQPHGVLQDTQGGPVLAPGSAVSVKAVGNHAEHYELSLASLTLTATRHKVTGDDMAVRIYHVSNHE